MLLRKCERFLLFGTVSLAVLLALPGEAAARRKRLRPGDSVSAAAAQLKPGDTLILKKGIYEQSVRLSGLKGTAKRPVTIEADGEVVIRPPTGDGVWIQEDCRYVVISGLRIEGAKRAGIYIELGRDILIRGCAISGSGKSAIITVKGQAITIEDCELQGAVSGHGIDINDTDTPTIRRCRIARNGGCGITLSASESGACDGLVTGALIEDNRIEANGGNGNPAINLYAVDRCVVRRNLLALNMGGGIALFRPRESELRGTDNEFVNNTVYFVPGMGRYALQVIKGNVNTVVHHNILVCGAGPAFEVDASSLSGLKSWANVYYTYEDKPAIRCEDRPVTIEEWRTLSQGDAESAVADPMFVDPLAGNFDLKVGSPAATIGAGAPGGSVR